MKLEDVLKENEGKKVNISYETPSGESHTVYGILELVEQDFIRIKAAITVIYINRQTCCITEFGVLE